MQDRREFMRASSVMSLALAAGVLKPEVAFAAEWNKGAFEGKSVADVVKAMGGASAADSKLIEIGGAEIAENGAVVPIVINSKLPKTQLIALLVEKNPNAMSSNFIIGENTVPEVSIRVKMGQTSNVHALVKADNKWYVATKEVKVTLGGCGG